MDYGFSSSNFIKFQFFKISSKNTKKNSTKTWFLLQFLKYNFYHCQKYTVAGNCFKALSDSRLTQERYSSYITSSYGSIQQSPTLSIKGWLMIWKRGGDVCILDNLPSTPSCSPWCGRDVNRGMDHRQLRYSPQTSADTRTDGRSYGRDNTRATGDRKDNKNK